MTKVTKMTITSYKWQLQVTNDNYKLQMTITSYKWQLQIINDKSHKWQLQIINDISPMSQIPSKKTIDNTVKLGYKKLLGTVEICLLKARLTITMQVKA